MIRWPPHKIGARARGAWHGPGAIACLGRSLSLRPLHVSAGDSESGLWYRCMATPYPPPACTVRVALTPFSIFTLAMALVVRCQSRWQPQPGSFCWTSHTGTRCIILHVACAYHRVNNNTLPPCPCLDLKKSAMMLQWPAVGAHHGRASLPGGSEGRGFKLFHGRVFVGVAGGRRHLRPSPSP
jgi:hypothetical protein